MYPVLTQQQTLWLYHLVSTQQLAFLLNYIVLTLKPSSQVGDFTLCDENSSSGGGLKKGKCSPLKKKNILTT